MRGLAVLLIVVMVLVSSPAWALVLAWDAPTTYTDGTTLNPATELASYKIYYGTASQTYTSVISILNPGTLTVSYSPTLLAGTYYFAVTTVDNNGQESGYSNEVLKTVSATTPSAITNFAASTAVIH